MAKNRYFKSTVRIARSIIEIKYKNEVDNLALYCLSNWTKIEGIVRFQSCAFHQKMSVKSSDITTLYDYTYNQEAYF